MTTVVEAAPPSGAAVAEPGAGQERLSGADAPGSGRRGRGVLPHLLLYAAVLLILVPFQSLNSTWSVDEGLYVLEVEALQQGSWEAGYWAEDLDPEGRWFPLDNHARGPEGYYPYVKAPAYPLALYGLSEVLGDTLGLHVLGLLGALGAALAAWLLAGLVDRRAAPYAFWLCAVSPVLLNAFAVWAHAPSAAVAGLTAYAALRCLRDGPTPLRTAGLVAGVTASLLVRTEGLLFAMSLGAVIGTWGLIGFVRRDPQGLRRLLIGSAVGMVAIVVNNLEQGWSASILGGFTTNDYVRHGQEPFLVGRVRGALRILFEGSSITSFEGAAVVIILGVAVAAVALRTRFRRGGQVAAAAVLLAVLAFVVHFAGTSRDSIPGIVVAWPVGIVGLLLTRPRSASWAERLLLAVIGLELFATLATQYEVGGGFEWGARFLSPLYPLIAVLAAVALRRVFADRRVDRRISVAALVLLALVPVAGGLQAANERRTLVDRLSALVERTDGPVVTSYPFMAQSAYRTHPDHQWLQVPEAQIPEALERLAAAGYDRVTVQRPVDWWGEGRDLPGGYEIVEEHDFPYPGIASFEGFVVLSRS